MIKIIWKFQVNPAHIIEFENRYGCNGDWAQLFQSSDQYHGTQLLKDQNTSGQYLTIDKWDNLESFERFKAEHLEAYQALDQACENLTFLEEKIGIFEVV